MHKIQVSTELSILINAALKDENDLPISVSRNELNWDSLMKLAKWHQVRPLLFDYLGKNRNMQVPEKYNQLLRDSTITQAVTNMSFLRTSIDFYEQLITSGVQAFLMKGALWAWMLYDKPGAREFGDIDYFINKHDIKDSLKILSRNGFEPDAYRTFLLEKGELQNYT